MGLFDLMQGQETTGVPDVNQLKVGPPKDEAEFQQRKSVWAQIFDRMGSDPNLQRAVILAGAQMMQMGGRGASTGEALGKGIATGMTAYEGGKAAQAESARADRKEKREEETHRSRMNDAASNREWAEKTRPMELQRLQAEIDAIPDAREKARLMNEKLKLELQQSPELFNAELERIRASTRAADRQGTAALRETDQQRAVEAYMMLPEVQELPEGQRRAKATQLYLQDQRGVPTGMKQDYRDQEATDFYNFIEGLDEEQKQQQFIMMNDREKLLYARGKALSSKGGASPASAPAAAPASRVISAAEIRAAREKAQRTSGGPIRQVGE